MNMFISSFRQKKKYNVISLQEIMNRRKLTEMLLCFAISSLPSLQDMNNCKQSFKFIYKYM